MSIGKDAFSLLKKISFERLAGTAKEFEALNIIKEAINKIGNIETEVTEFEINRCEIKTAKFAVTEPIYKEYEVTGYEMGQIVKEGIEKDFYYLEKEDYIPVLDLKDKIVLLSTRPSYKTYESLINAGVAGLIAPSGSIYDNKKETDLEERELRERHYKNGRIPALSIRMKDAEDLVLQHPTKVKIVLDMEENKVKSHNLVATLPGSTKPEEIMCFTAHYDSVRFSSGAYDNGTGSVTIFELLKYYYKNEHARTLKFIWCGSEERGLLGSWDYVNTNEEVIKNTKMCFNVDMTGIVIGTDIAVCTGSTGLVDFVNYYSKLKGHLIRVSQGVYSSDSTPFADKGIPAISFARISPIGGAEIHSRKDQLELIKPEYLEDMIVYMQGITSEFINAIYLPIDEMPENMKSDLDKYIGRK